MLRQSKNQYGHILRALFLAQVQNTRSKRFALFHQIHFQRARIARFPQPRDGLKYAGLLRQILDSPTFLLPRYLSRTTRS